MKDYLKAVGAVVGFVLVITGFRFIYFQSNLEATLPLISMVCLLMLAFAGDVAFDEWIAEQDRKKKVAQREQ